MLLDRYDQVGQPMSMYYVVSVNGDEATILDVKTGKVWPFSVGFMEQLLKNPIGGSGNCAFRIAG